MKKFFVLASSVVILLVFSVVDWHRNDSLQVFPGMVMDTSLIIIFSHYTPLEQSAFKLLFSSKLCHLLCRINLFNAALSGYVIDQVIIERDLFTMYLVERDSSHYLLHVGDYYFREPLPYSTVAIALDHEIGHIAYESLSDSARQALALYWTEFNSAMLSVYQEDKYVSCVPCAIPFSLGHSEDSPQELFASSFALYVFFDSRLPFSFDPVLLRLVAPWYQWRKIVFARASLCEMW